MSTHLYQYQPYHYSYEYDYVFAGAGAASLSLVVRMILSGRFNNSSFLVVDRDRKDTNDRTWCFWESGRGLFEELVYKSWDQIWFHGKGFSRKYAIRPYKYKMIRAIDFYNYCLDLLKRQSNVQLLFEPVKSIQSLDEGAKLVLENNETYFAKKFLFNSIPFEGPRKEPGKHDFLQQFKGWFVETEQPFFDASACTLMDFRIDQERGASFVYTMPIDEHKALVEYTVFNKELLTDEEYEGGLEGYLRDQLQLKHYSVTQKEKGVIPMSSNPFPAGDGNIINIGTAGGQTKPSSGYTFQFIQRNSAAILYSMLNYGHPRPVDRTHEGRFLFYDSVLLDVLAHKEISGADIFTRLFKRNSARRIFRFLDNNTWLAEELLLISSLPVGPFWRAAMRQLRSGESSDTPQVADT